MIRAWRLVKKAHESSAFSGEGARRFGGRWNHRGTAVVYLSDTLSLAALELFVHLGTGHGSLMFATFEVKIPSGILPTIFQAKDLPINWRAEPAPDSCKDIGTKWVKDAESALLSVPSVIVPVQVNYVLNIAHPKYKKIIVNQHEDFSFDPRMWK